MRILYLFGRFPRLDTETFLLNEMDALQKRGHDVWVLADQKENFSETDLHELVVTNRFMDKVIVGEIYRRGLVKFWHFLKQVVTGLFSCPLKTIRNLFFVFAENRYYRGGNFWTKLDNYLLWEKISSERFDVVYAPFAHVEKIDRGLTVAGAVQARFVAAWRAFDLYGFRDQKELENSRKILKRIDRVLTISRFNKQWLESQHGLFINIPVVHSAIDPDKFRPTERKAVGDLALGQDGTINRDIKIGQDKKIGQDGVIKIITVARFVEKKGIEYLLRALADLKKTGLRFNYTLIGEGPLKEEYERLVGELGLSNWITIRAAVKQELIKTALEQADLMVLPCVVAADGDVDILPNVLKEAMAMELPVITSNISGIEELVVDDENGLLVPAKDSVALGAAIKKLAADPVLRREFGRAGRKKIITDFNINTEVKKLIQIFTEAVYKENKPNV